MRRNNGNGEDVNVLISIIIVAPSSKDSMSRKLIVTLVYLVWKVLIYWNIYAYIPAL
jgi:hypothetical protein